MPIREGTTVRAATLDDVASIRSLLALMDQDDGATRGADLDAAALRTALATSWIHTLLAFEERKLVGLVTGHETIATLGTNRAYWLDDLYVVPGCRRSGVATALLAALCDRARAQGVDRIEWHVYADNASAIAFYDKLGGTIFSRSRIGRLSGEAMRKLSGA